MSKQHQLTSQKIREIRICSFGLASESSEQDITLSNRYKNRPHKMLFELDQLPNQHCWLLAVPWCQFCRRAIYLF